MLTSTPFASYRVDGTISNRFELGFDFIEAGVILRVRESAVRRPSLDPSRIETAWQTSSGVIG